MRYLLIFLLLGFAGVALWTWLTLAWAYSDGTRAGVLQKFSHRGWVCKTQEGELAQYVVAGVSPQFWQFSVRDPAVGTQLEKLVGARVQLHYTEHRGVPTGCFADTSYFVDRVTVIDAGPTGPGPTGLGPTGPGPVGPASSAPPAVTAPQADPAASATPAISPPPTAVPSSPPPGP
jgi:hypothetical protein